MNKKTSDHIESAILEAIKDYDGSIVPTPFSTLLSLGELIDRLSIVNFKLYRLKDTVMNSTDDKEFLARAAIDDVALVMERSRLKRCIDEKIELMVQGKTTYNKEVKSYE